MKRMKKSKLRQAGLSTSILIGFAATALILLLGSIGLTAMILKGVMDVGAINYSAPIVLLLGTFLGGYISGKLVENDKLIACGGVAGAILFILLTITILFFGGKFQNVIVNVTAILLGSAGGFTLNLRKPKTKYHRRR